MTQATWNTSASIALLVIGISLNTIGIALMRAGAIRYVLMIAGLALILTAVLRLVNRDAVKSPPDSPDGPAA
jgi:glucose dehydrogenase